MSPPEVSVVVPARDAARTLPALLESLEAQTASRDRFEVIVVDNASRDDTAAVAAAHGAKVAFEPIPNRARARNRGTGMAAAPLLAFTDADCTVGPRWVEALAECLAEAPLVAGPIELTTDDPPSLLQRFELLSRFGQQRRVEESGWAATANLAVSRAAFEAIDGFDSAYRHIGEDVDFCLRAARAGYPLAWCPGAAVAHAAESRVGPFLRRAMRHGYSSTQHHHRIGGGVGRRYWRHPGPLVRGDWPLRRFGVESASLDRRERRRLMVLARVEYAARMAGSIWAELRRAR